MKTWKDIIAEATAAEIRRAGEAALRDEMKKRKKKKKENQKPSKYQDYLERQLAFKKEKYEAQKAAQIEKLKQGKIQEPLDKAKASLTNIKTERITDKDKDPTAYSKLIGNIGNTAVGVGGALYHGVRALAAKRAAAKEAEEAKKRHQEQEKRKRMTAGRPPKPKNPKEVLDRMNNMKEGYSNWRNELLIEVDDKEKKEKIINVMKGKNKIIINPDEKGFREEVIKEASPAWQRKEGKNPEGGLNKKGIASYRRENPGSKLSLAVTTPPSKLNPDSKAAKRRKSFCARMSGMPGPMKDEKGRPTRKALSLRKWNC